ncbi:hypothetical protein J1D01_10405 [Seonamhaeicola sp. NFXS20]|uniref:hypothetical protein n=1 Tax=Seonamhaeicola sp. NFXS20 TaxID=2816959 RepID=UPI003B8DD471
MKLVGLHTFCHDNDDDDDLDTSCKICELAITHNLTPVLSIQSQEFSIENTEIVNNHHVLVNYSFIISNTITSSKLFSRPPPSLM